MKSMPPTDKTELLEYQIKKLADDLKRAEIQFTEDLRRAEIQFAADLDKCEKHQEKTDKGLKALEDQRNNFFIWGIVALGSGVVGMGTFIVNLFISGKTPS